MCHCSANTRLGGTPVIWRPEDKQKPAPKRPNSTEIYRPDVFETIEAKIKELSEELRALSLDIHGETSFLVPKHLQSYLICVSFYRSGHPELGFKEL